MYRERPVAGHVLDIFDLGFWWHLAWYKHVQESHGIKLTTTEIRAFGAQPQILYLRGTVASRYGRAAIFRGLDILAEALRKDSTITFLFHQLKQPLALAVCKLCNKRLWMLYVCTNTDAHLHMYAYMFRHWLQFFQEAVELGREA